MDWRDRLDYLWTDFRSRPERVRLAMHLSVVGAALLCAGILFLLTRGEPRPPRPARPRPQAPPVAEPAATVQDAFAFARDLEPRLRADRRFERVYLVPTAATADQRHSKVLIMGEVASDDDLRALQAETVRAGLPVTVEWQVIVSGR